MAAVRHHHLSVTSLKPFEANPDKFVCGCLKGLPYFSAKIAASSSRRDEDFGMDALQETRPGTDNHAEFFL
jgi:hypothetical protein